jgi:hypothetical protein
MEPYRCWNSPGSIDKDQIRGRQGGNSLLDEPGYRNPDQRLRDGTENADSPRLPASRSAALAAAVLLAFFAYYSITAHYLPLGAGPDWQAHDDVSLFVYNHGRLAVLPRDEAELKFTAYGGTHALRPPLSSAVSALAARLQSPDGMEDLRRAFRAGSVLFGALTTAVVAFALSQFFGSIATGWVGSLLVGLMPQFAFISSYNNDDAAAIFSATLVLAVLLWVYRRGPSLGSAVWLGAASGLILSSKMSAWLLGPTVILFLAVFVRGRPHRLLQFGSAAAIATIVAGGWWIGFNVYHYGIDDPFTLRTVAEVAQRHAHLPPKVASTFAEQGIGYWDLFAGNYDGFWWKTAKSTIGNLDWLRVPVGWLAYAVYLAVILSGLAYGLVRAGLLAWRPNRNSEQAEQERREGLLCGLLVFAVLFQVWMYAWANIHSDIQLQGRYLLPMVLAPVVLFFIWSRRAVWRGLRAMQRRGALPRLVDAADVRRALAALAVGGVLLMHANVVLNHVMRFYDPVIYDLDVGPFKPLLLSWDALESTYQIDEFDARGSEIRLTARTNDPQFVISLARPEVCKRLKGHRVLRITMEPGLEGRFQIFFDRGYGFRESESLSSYYGGERGNEVYFVFGLQECRRMRFDPAEAPGTIRIREIAVAGLKITDPMPPAPPRRPKTAGGMGSD